MEGEVRGGDFGCWLSKVRVKKGVVLDGFGRRELCKNSEVGNTLAVGSCCWVGIYEESQMVRLGRSIGFGGVGWWCKLLLGKGL